MLARSASAADTFVHCEMRGLGKSQDRVILPSLQGRSGRVVGWWRSGCGGWVSTLTFKSCVKPLDGVSTKDEPKPTTWPDFTMFSRTLRKTPTLAQIKGAFWARHLGRLRGHTCPDLLDTGCFRSSPAWHTLPPSPMARGAKVAYKEKVICTSKEIV